MSKVFNQIFITRKDVSRDFCKSRNFLRLRVIPEYFREYVKSTKYLELLAIPRNKWPFCTYFLTDLSHFRKKYENDKYSYLFHKTLVRCSRDSFFLLNQIEYLWMFYIWKIDTEIWYINSMRRHLMFECILKGKETHIWTFLTSDLYWEHYFSWYQQFIPFYANN